MGAVKFSLHGSSVVGGSSHSSCRIFFSLLLESLCALQHTLVLQAVPDLLL